MELEEGLGYYEAVNSDDVPEGAEIEKEPLEGKSIYLASDGRFWQFGGGFIRHLLVPRQLWEQASPGERTYDRTKRQTSPKLPKRSRKGYRPLPVNEDGVALRPVQESRADALRRGRRG